MIAYKLFKIKNQPNVYIGLEPHIFHQTYLYLKYFSCHSRVVKRHVGTSFIYIRTNVPTYILALNNIYISTFIMDLSMLIEKYLAIKIDST